MTFDYTNGRNANFLVRVYAWNQDDRMYFASMKKAREFYKNLLTKEWEKDTIISLYDLKKDTRKEYTRI